MKRTIVTTSWDDGHILDQKLAELLAKYNLPATFYISPETREIPPSERLTASQTSTLSQQFEIGAHTIHHPELTRIPLSQANVEIIESKHFLEDLLAKPVDMFCYPRGKYNAQVADMVAAAGFLGAR